MESQPVKPNVTFLPLPLPGHINPMVDIARLFAKHGANVSIITTQAIALKFQKVIDSDFTSGYPIKIHKLQFPAAQVGLPDGGENVRAGTTDDFLNKILLGISMLKSQIEDLFHDLQSDCLVTDMFYTWTVDSAAKLGVPRLHFHVSSYFANCVGHSLMKYAPHEKVASDTERFSIPGLPQNIEMTTLQIEEWVRTKNHGSDFFEEIYESQRRSYGILCNSFHAIEGDYEKLCESTLGVKCWSVGPVSAWVNKYDGAEKTKNKEQMEEDLLNWLDSKENESVLYVSFGSLTRHCYAQLLEIAHGLEDSGHNFIWVVRNMEGVEDGESSLPKGFEQRMKESKKGYIIWNWAPQLLIVNHPAIGGIITQCGWNAVLESLGVGLPVITWPMFAEQFYNEKLLTDVLKVGVPVGAKVNSFWTDPDADAMVSREEVEKAVKFLMERGEESTQMWKRARKLQGAAKMATEEGGSSHNDLVQLIDELKSLKISKASEKTN